MKKIKIISAASAKVLVNEKLDKLRNSKELDIILNELQLLIEDAAKSGTSQIFYDDPQKDFVYSNLFRVLKNTLNNRGYSVDHGCTSNYTNIMW